MSTTDIREDIRAALATIPYSDFLAATKDILEVLGYQSDRTLELPSSVDGFIDEFPAPRPNTKTEQVFREYVRSVQLVFQMTSDEIASIDLGTTSLYKGQQQSLIFFAVELKKANYVHGTYSDLTREINKRISVPTVVFFRAGDRLTITFINRRSHRRDSSRDVLEPATSLIKDIPLKNPRRIHIDSLVELSLSECAKWMDAHEKSKNFDSLLAAWKAKLPTEELDQQFYRQLSNWLEWAVSKAKFSEGEENILRFYFNDIATSIPLSRDREAELAYRIKNGDMHARDEMVQANLRFVVCVARKYQNRGLSLPDLISAGNLGLITAADRFDGTKGHKFITYAVWWIRQSILQTLAEHVRIVRLPLNKISLLKDISRKLNQDRTTEPDIKEIVSELEVSPKEVLEISTDELEVPAEEVLEISTDELEVPAEEVLEEIADDLGVPVKEILETILSARAVCSLDEPFTDECSLIDILVDEATVPPDADILRESVQEQFETALRTLDERELRIIRLYFGLDGNKALTLEEIGDMMNLTRERIRQLKERALSKLRRRACYQELKTLIT